jgi:hypothetical protein
MKFLDNEAPLDRAIRIVLGFGLAIAVSGLGTNLLLAQVRNKGYRGRR